MTNYHFIGISGIGMSALAHILLDQECSVSGSDLVESFSHLIDKGAKCYGKHDGDNIPENSVVVYGSAIPLVNEEYRTAIEKKYTLLHRSELLMKLMKHNIRVLVSGSHGKTTTTAMLISVFKKAGKDPSFVLGGLYEELNGKKGSGRIFIAEADESDGSIRNYHPDAAIITNLDCSEHISNYANIESLKTVFQEFMLKVQDPSLLFYCGDDSGLASIDINAGVSFGFSKDCNLRILDWKQNGWKSCFDFIFEGKIYRDVELFMSGRHNILNAAAVFGLSLHLGVQEESIRRALSGFGTVKRRFERRREDSSLVLIDDYAHHPREILASLKALRTAVGNRRIVAVCQPHRYSRVKEVMDDYLAVFSHADVVVVTDIYAAGEEEIQGVSGQILAERLSRVFLEEVHYVTRERLDEFLKTVLMQHDVCITLGAGDVNAVHNELVVFQPKKLKLGLIFGGRSCEHTVSLMSARNVYNGLENNDCYEIACFGIDKQGRWLLNAEDFLKDVSYETVPIGRGESFGSPAIMSAINNCDCMVPILHGPYSEDGKLQGFFEFINKPYTGPDCRSAAVSMDKLLTKRLASGVGIPVVPYYDFTYTQWLFDPDKILTEITDSFTFPVVLKTVHLGSSIGIFLINDIRELEKMLLKAFEYDFHVFIEESRLGCKEMEFSFLGDFKSGFLVKAGPSERAGGGNFIGYNNKYGFGDCQEVKAVFELNIPQEVLDKGSVLAEKCYNAINCFGGCRIDFFFDQRTNDWWLSEVNTIPGMTKHSAFPQALRSVGFDIKKVCESLVIGGLYKNRLLNKHSSTDAS
ncbi:MAG: UDP-N-acetylmuramate--L-alanine ligase [Victivallaceae bacterium]